MPNRNAPWIGVGTSGHWTNVDDALRDSGLNYTVVDEPVYDVTGAIIPGYKMNRRIDNNQQMGLVTTRYGIVQNNTAFNLITPFLQNGAKIIQCGQTISGMVFIVAECTMFNALGDAYKLYVCMMNSFNSRYPLLMFMTPIRVICQNMFRKLIDGCDNVLSIKHGLLAENRIENALAACSVLSEYQTKFIGKLDQAATRHIDSSFVDSFVLDLFPDPDKESKQYKTSLAKVEEQRDIFLNTCYHAPDNANFTGTAMGLLNAYYDYLTHRESVRANKDWEERRLVGMMTGDDVKPKLLKQLIS